MIMVVIAGLTPGKEHSLTTLRIFWQLHHRQTGVRELKAQTNGCQRLTAVDILSGGIG
jgi:hypothetical protein